MRHTGWLPQPVLIHAIPPEIAIEEDHKTAASHQDQKDVLQKLTKSKARWKRAFLTLTHRGAPWEIYSYFFTEFTTVPQDQLDLPEPLSAIWVMASFGDKGFTGTEGTGRRFNQSMDKCVQLMITNLQAV